MPSLRFNKLKPVKKRAFLRMAYKEFSLHSYEGASITRLVGNLKMAKGSIYQYFIDKDDMYNYLVSHVNEQLSTLIDRACPKPAPNLSFYNWYQTFVLVQLKFFLSFPVYGVLLVRNQTDKIGKNEAYISFEFKQISEAMKIHKEKLVEERIYWLHCLPLIIFRYIIESDKINLTELIEKERLINLSTDKLINLYNSFMG